MGDAGSVEFVFVMPRARDYQRHLPAMLRSPELEVDDPGFVVVFAEGVVPAVGGVGTSDDDSGRYVCISVDGQPNLYSNVDITGMQVDIGTTQASAAPIALPTGTPVARATPTPTLTPEPAPSWVADLTGQLDCDGPSSSVGGELDEQIGGEAGSVISPEIAIEVWSGQTMFTGLPRSGYTLTDQTAHWARFAFTVEGRPKAIVVTSDTWSGEGVGWTRWRSSRAMRPNSGKGST